MMEHLDQLQVENGLRDMARLTWVFYKALRDEGFDRREAMILTVHWMHDMMEGESE